MPSPTRPSIAFKTSLASRITPTSICSLHSLAATTAINIFSWISLMKDDNPSIQQLLLRTLTSNSYYCVVAPDQGPGRGVDISHRERLDRRREHGKPVEPVRQGAIGPDAGYVVHTDGQRRQSMVRLGRVQTRHPDLRGRLVSPCPTSLSTRTSSL